MMKNNKILDSLYYRFVPENKKIVFDSQLGLKHQDILLVINLSKMNQMIFNFGSATQGGTFINGELILVYDTTGMSSSDKLMVIVRDKDESKFYLEKIFNEISNQNKKTEFLIDN